MQLQVIHTPGVLDVNVRYHPASDSLSVWINGTDLDSRSVHGWKATETLTGLFFGAAEHRNFGPLLDELLETATTAGQQRIMEEIMSRV